MYAASKHAVNSLTCSMRVDLQKEGFKDVHVTLFSPGVVATDFGAHSIGGGPVIDNRTIPGAQAVEEVAQGIIDCIKNPKADVYSRPGYHGQFGCEILPSSSTTLALFTNFVHHHFASTCNTESHFCNVTCTVLQIWWLSITPLRMWKMWKDMWISGLLASPRPSRATSARHQT